MLLVGTVLISLNTHCVCLVSVDAGGSELSVGAGADDVGECTGFGGGVCREILGDAGGGAHVTGDQLLQPGYDGAHRDGAQC